MAVYLKNATWVDWQSLEMQQANLLVSPGKLEFVDAPPQSAACDTTLDCRGKLVTRAFACGHHHVYSALARGMPAPSRVPQNFLDILKLIWWRLDKSLDLEMIEASALVTAVECALNGVTFVIDHHASPFACKGSLEIIAKAFDKVGVSHLLCYELSDRDGEAAAREGLDETEEYLGQRQQGLVGLHASFTVGDSLLQKAIDLAAKYESGLHIHVAEDLADQQHCVETYGCRVVERLHRAGALVSPRTILVHCLHLSEEERRLVAESPVHVAQNTDSNMNNGVGTFLHAGLGERILLGTDGMHSDMLRSARAAYLASQATEGVSPQGVYQRLRRVHRYASENEFKGEGEDNLVVLDYDPPTPLNAGNFAAHMIYGMRSAHVESVISSGKLIVRERKVLGVDQTQVLEHAREMARKLWARMDRQLAV